MFAPAFFTALLAFIAVVHADPTPSDPSPGDVFNEGASCHIDWDVDTTGIWTVMNIELMSGNNEEMQYMTTVATVNGADPKKTGFDYTCPSVTPNAPIYFYQFTTPYSNTSHWTGRFAIADSSGKRVPAANSTQPDGSAIPWGIGALTGPSSAVPEPSAGQSIGGAQAIASGSPSSTPSSSASASTSAPNSSSSPPASKLGMLTVSGAKPSGSSSTSPSLPSGSSTTNGAGVLEVNSHVFHAAVALGVAALTFSVAL
ncbi:hypothetical protein BKA93DRAFT_902666 [Sparassis latifolia]